MSRHKGKSAGHLNEKDFPHLVELALPSGDLQDQEFDAFHCERGIPIRCGSDRYDEGQLYVRFCFPTAAHAYAFRDRFGGEYLTYPLRRLRRVVLKR